MQTGNLTVFLNALLVINPANGVLLIGAGNGHGELVEWLIQNKVNAVTLVEPQDVAFQQLETNIASLVSLENQNWTLHKEVVAEHPGLVDFYYTSKSTENGLISPELLNDIWPNLALVQKETLSATSLDTLNVNAAQILNWLMIDCLGALKAIGQAQNLANVDVAIIKVLFNTKDTNTYSDYAGILALLNAQGFDEKYRQSGLHPDIGYVVFVRNYQAQFKELKQDLSAITSAYAQALTLHQTEWAAWQDAKQSNEKQVEQQAAALKQQQAQLKLCQQQLNGLQTTHAQALAQHQTEQAAWQEERKNLTESRDVISNKLNILNEKCQILIDSNAQFESTQKMLESELKNAETQIDVIRNLLAIGNE